MESSTVTPCGPPACMSISVRPRQGRISASPAPAHQVCLDLAPDAASAWTLEPPGFMLHALPQGGRLVSHAVASGQFDGPHPFWDAQGRLID
jgi:hypothetical protein